MAREKEREREERRRRERNWHYPAARKKGINATALHGPRLSIFRATAREKQLHSVASAQHPEEMSPLLRGPDSKPPPSTFTALRADLLGPLTSDQLASPRTRVWDHLGRADGGFHKPLQAQYQPL